MEKKDALAWLGAHENLSDAQIESLCRDKWLIMERSASKEIRRDYRCTLEEYRTGLTDVVHALIPDEATRRRIKGGEQIQSGRKESDKEDSFLRKFLRWFALLMPERSPKVNMYGSRHVILDDDQSKIGPRSDVPDGAGNISVPGQRELVNKVNQNVKSGVNMSPASDKMNKHEQQTQVGIVSSKVLWVVLLVGVINMILTIFVLFL